MKTLYTLGESFRQQFVHMWCFLRVFKGFSLVGSLCKWNKRDSFNHSYFSNRQQHVELHGCFIDVKPVRRTRVFFRPDKNRKCERILWKHPTQGTSWLVNDSRNHSLFSLVPRVKGFAIFSSFLSFAHCTKTFFQCCVLFLVSL